MSSGMPEMEGGRLPDYPEGYGRPLYVPVEAWNRMVGRSRVVSLVATVVACALTVVLPVTLLRTNAYPSSDPPLLVWVLTFELLIGTITGISIYRFWSNAGPPPAVFSRGVLLNRVWMGRMRRTFVPFDEVESTKWCLKDLCLRHGREHVMEGKLFPDRVLLMVERMAKVKPK